MKTFAIIELEEGGLNVVVGGRDGGAIRVHHSGRVPMPDLGRDALTNALGEIDKDTLQGVSGVHVVLGDRRMQHFLATVPKLSVPDAVKFVMREAVRTTGTQSTTEVLVATRLVRRLPHGRFVLATTALARNVWETMRDAFAVNGLEVLGLHSMESCLALAATAPDGKPAAVLECNGGRARFVLCDAQSPLQVRRFLIGSGDSSPSALADQLAMELPRTFEWLRETNQPLPSTLWLGTRVAIEDEAMLMLRSDDLQMVRRAAPPLVMADDMVMPGLGVAMLLTRLCAGQSLPSLLQEPGFVLPMPMTRVAGLAAMLLTGIAGSWCAVVDGRDWLHTRCEQETLAADSQHLSGQLTLAPGGAATGPGAAAERLQTALTMRRPISRLLADVSNCADTQLHVEDMKFASTDRIVVSGIVQGGTRQEALKAIARFSQQLGKLPYVVSGGDEEITEVPRLRNCFKFKLGMRWRNA